MKIYKSLLWLLATLWFVGGVSAGSSLSVGQIIKANNTFAFDLYAQRAKAPGNIALSPLSISSTLAATSAGAQGETDRQMANTLHLPNSGENVHVGFAGLLEAIKASNTSGGQFALANALWVQKGYRFSDAFQRLLQDRYRAIVHQIDLTGWPNDFDPAKAAEARSQINDWVASQTHDKIQGIIPSGVPGGSARLLLVSAIWFKGSWELPFDRSLTKDSPFWLAPEKSVSVPMMRLKATFKMAEDGDVQVLEIPYSSNRFSMVIFLPRKRGGLGEFEKQLTSERVMQLLRKSRAQKVIISLPRFKSSSGFGLVEPLQALGMKDAFSESAADFSLITAERPFFVEAVFHKVYVTVDEEGTEAAAATGLSHTDSFPEAFDANHPFLFLIRDTKTSCILFLGRVADPSKE